MFNFFDLDIIPTLLSGFNAKKVLLIGLSNEIIFDELLTYCINNNSILYTVDNEINIEDILNKNNLLNNSDNYRKDNVKHFKGEILNILSYLKNFDAVLINDDPNWYTVFNELNLIKKNNLKFPLVFICNNKYPHKRRDSYINPNRIPQEYRHECSSELHIKYEENNEIKHAKINDGFCHAIYKETPKNGVLTAIEDFLNENKSLNSLDINFLEGVSLIYNNSFSTKNKIKKILNKENEFKYNESELSDKVIENNLLLKQISKIKLDESNIEKMELKIEKNEEEIEIYKKEIKTQRDQINTIKNQVSIKETQLQEIKSELNTANSEKEENIKLNKQKNQQIKEYKEKIDSQLNQINTIKNQVSIKETQLQEIKSELNTANSEKEENIKLNKQNHENSLKIKKELNEKEKKIDTLKQESTLQLSKIEQKEYCITCFKDEISNNQLEINYLKNFSLTKKLLSPLSYLYLILKSNPQEISINLKLYKALKNSSCFDIGFYLNNNKDLLESKWYKYFSPELHYVCNGFSENRKFNKKYFNRNSKKDLLNYLLACNK